MKGYQSNVRSCWLIKWEKLTDGKAENSPHLYPAISGIATVSKLSDATHMHNPTFWGLQKSHNLISGILHHHLLLISWSEVYSDRDPVMHSIYEQCMPACPPYPPCWCRKTAQQCHTLDRYFHSVELYLRQFHGITVKSFLPDGQVKSGV